MTLLYLFLIATNAFAFGNGSTDRDCDISQAFPGVCVCNAFAKRGTIELHIDCVEERADGKVNRSYFLTVED